MSCSNCQYGTYDPLSDVCDGCTHDSSTGWFGFTDHTVNQHFNSEEEQQDYYNRYDELFDEGDCGNDF